MHKRVRHTLQLERKGNNMSDQIHGQRTNAKWCSCLVKTVKSRIMWETVQSFLCTHHHDVARPVLDCAKEAKDDNDYVEEVGKDWGPLVAQEVKDLSF